MIPFNTNKIKIHLKSKLKTIKGILQKVLDLKSESNMEQIKIFDKTFWLSLVAFAILIIIICFLPYLLTSSSWNDLDFKTTGPIGDTIGGIMGPFIAIAASILTFLAFWVQFKANMQYKTDLNNQKTASEKEKIEARFFELLKFHRDNVSELNYTIYSAKQTDHTSNENLVEEIVGGRKVFKIIYDDFISLNNDLTWVFKTVKLEDVYEVNYLDKMKSNSRLENSDLYLLNLARIDIVYSIIFFGLSKDDQMIIQDIFNDRYKKDFLNKLVEFSSLKPKKDSIYWNRWVRLNQLEDDKKLEYLDKFIKYRSQEINNQKRDNNGFQNEEVKFRSIYYKNNYFKFYGGHQFRLGHYFRNLYQIVSYINNSNQINYEQKYFMIKLLRGQLSSFEQSIIFLNSLSYMGRRWEIEDIHNPSEKIKVNDQLITKYNLIKNIFNKSINEEIDVTQFYPNVEFEGVNIISQKETNGIYRRQFK